MKPPAFDYHAPDTLEQALDELARAGGDAAVLAGGQSLMPLLALRMASPSVVVDINRIAALSGISRQESGWTRIGAVTRQNRALTDSLVGAHAPAVAQALALVGHHQTRNRGTICGSLAFADPAAELPATMLTLGGELEVQRTGASRRVPADAFFLGPYTTAIETGEMVTAVHVPDWPEGTVTLVQEVAPRAGDFALVGLVCAIAVRDGGVDRAAIGWFGMGPGPIRSRAAEQAMLGQSLAGLDLRGLGELAVSETDPLDDVHASAAYRRRVGPRVFEKALAEALGVRRAA